MNYNLELKKLKIDIHRYDFWASENWTHIFLLEIIWLVQNRLTLKKKFGLIFVKKMSNQNHWSVFWQKMDQLFFQLNLFFGPTRWILALKIGSKILSKKPWSNFQKPKNHAYECRFSIFSILSCSSYPTLQHGYNQFAWCQS